MGPPGTPSAARACGASDATFTAKISLGDGDTMRVKLVPGMSFRDLASVVTEASGGAAARRPATPTLTYTDDADESCDLSGDADLDECRAACARSGTIRVRATFGGGGGQRLRV